MLHAPRPLKGRFARRREAGLRCGALRAGLARPALGGAGAPPGGTTASCQELADDPRQL